MERLLGVTNRVLDASDKKKPMSSVFFKPFDSGVDFIYRSAAIITVPLLSAALTLYVALDALFQICRAITFLIKDKPEVVKDATNKLKKDLVVLLFGLIMTPLTPFIEAVDVIGSGIANLKEEVVSDFEPCFSPK